MRGFNSKIGFTMIELLVVIVIIGVLAVSMMPVIGRFIKAGDDTVSRNNLMRLGRAAIAYRSDHGNCYPAAGGYFTQFSIYADGRREDRYGRARGWVYFEHDCPRAKGDAEAADQIGDGNHGIYGWGVLEEDTIRGDEVNEEGCCLCFNSTSREGGMNARPASWYGRASGEYSPAEVAIRNGALFQYLNADVSAYSNPTFRERAQRELGIARTQVTRAYAMNVIAGSDENLYDTGRPKYHGGGIERDYCHPENSIGHSAIRLGQNTLKAYESTSENADDFHEVLPARTILFVELDLDNEAVSRANSLEGDQVWDWDGGDESMGFNHEDGGAMYAHVCFADGHVEAIRDPSPDPENPDIGRRQKLSKWYGSGGVNASGEKLD